VLGSKSGHVGAASVVLHHQLQKEKVSVSTSRLPQLVELTRRGHPGHVAKRCRHAHPRHRRSFSAVLGRGVAMLGLIRVHEAELPSLEQQHVARERHDDRIVAIARFMESHGDRLVVVVAHIREEARINGVARNGGGAGPGDVAGSSNEEGQDHTDQQPLDNQNGTAEVGRPSPVGQMLAGYVSACRCMGARHGCIHIVRRMACRSPTDKVRSLRTSSCAFEVTQPADARRPASQRCAEPESSARAFGAFARPTGPACARTAPVTTGLSPSAPRQVSAVTCTTSGLPPPTFSVFRSSPTVQATGPSGHVRAARGPRGPHVLRHPSWELLAPAEIACPPEKAGQCAGLLEKRAANLANADSLTGFAVRTPTELVDLDASLFQRRATINLVATDLNGVFAEVHEGTGRGRSKEPRFMWTSACASPQGSLP
jgi:hypothetical protein